MPDDLKIPASLDLRIPEVRERHDQALRDWKPGKAKALGEDSPRAKTDSKGRALPAGMDEGSWALLRSQEKEAKQEGGARLAALHAEEADQRAVKRAARDAKGDAAAKRKR
jgi:hypothetical protein